MKRPGRKLDNSSTPPYARVLAGRKALGNPPQEVLLHCRSWAGPSLKAADSYLDSVSSPLVMPGDTPEKWDWGCVAGLEVLVFPNGTHEGVCRQLASLLLHAKAAVVRVVTPSWTHVYRPGSL